MNKPLALSKKLLAWYDRVKRDLPWRRTGDPYGIWVSEIMLQQTQVKTVLNYYDKWMKAFPSVHTLAKASESDILKQWSGLGYYQRAKNLHRGAIEIVTDKKGILPVTFEEWLSLKGIGSYTASAIMSIAFNEPYPVLDGNGLRVFSRLMAYEKNVKTGDAQETLFAYGKQWMPKGRAGDFNQAIMELGATVCSPTKPACEVCPVSADCEAFRQQLTESIPLVPKRKKTEKIDVVIGILRKGNTIFIQKRPSKGMFADLWEFPGGKVKEGETALYALKRELREELNIHVKEASYLGQSKHHYTHFSVTFRVFEVKKWTGRIKLNSAVQSVFCTCEQFSEYAFPAANTKLFKLV